MNDLRGAAVIVGSLERRRIAAMVAGDVETLDELLHERLRFGHTNGLADDKAAYLAKFRTKAVTYRDADLQVESVSVFDTCALVNSRLSMTADLATGSVSLNVVALTVWIEGSGEWRMVAHRPTVVSL